MADFRITGSLNEVSKRVEVIETVASIENVGTGSQISVDNTGSLRTLVAGSDITIIQSATELTINAVGSGGVPGYDGGDGIDITPNPPGNDVISLTANAGTTTGIVVSSGEISLSDPYLGPYSIVSLSGGMDDNGQDIIIITNDQGEFISNLYFKSDGNHVITGTATTGTIRIDIPTTLVADNITFSVCNGHLTNASGVVIGSIVADLEINQQYIEGIKLVWSLSSGYTAPQAVVRLSGSIMLTTVIL